MPQTFEELRTPLFISTTNLTQAKHEVFHKGNLIDAILASISIPILFNPYEINGNLYVDGGLVKNLPASVIRDNCKLLIGSHVNHMPKNQLLKSTSQIFDRCVRISIYNTIKHDTKLCDVLIDPEKSGLVDITNFTIVSDIINIGYEEAKNKLQRRLMYKSKINK